MVFGIQVSTLLAERLSELLRHWAQNEPTLRHPLPDTPLVHRLRNVIWG
ncbi:MAG TPA: hypothetical protein VFO16_05990 [Pseudonocardiaceae bacterium]|nr:hypothetical protein [Pseudonocardiaceae bacterium]